jgi:hypothetical protein
MLRRFRMKFEIKSRLNSSLLFSVETENLKLAVEFAVKSGANLYGADLSWANLYRADLSRADLFGADLSGANLSGADLSRADLSGANLSWANLSWANLFGASLSRADLSGANLFGADLSVADLSRADLSGANLSRANLFGAEGVEKFPIQIGGHLHWLCTTHDGNLQIGCHVYSFEDWQEHANSIGKKEGYSKLDIKIYKLHIEHILKVSRLLWNAKKEVVGK